MTWLLALLLQAPPYQRSAFPHWIPCLDVRERVLLEESRRPVTFAADGCTIRAGEWLDVYTGELVTTPAALDVDHLIPLAAAWRAGAAAWPSARRRAYANALADPDHLVAVTARANRAKGSRGPATWLPPRRAARCWYVRAWQRIARTWRLELAADDQAAIARVLETCP